MPLEAVQGIGRRRGGIVGRLQFAGQHALDQLGDAAPDIGADVRHGNRRPAEIGEHGIRRRVQVEHGIEQRAVQIDQDGLDRRPQDQAFASSARIWLMMVS
jgi:hypothetical protein